MYSVTIENSGDMKFLATTKDYSFVIGVNGGGANPVETLIAGLCGCVGHYVRDFLTERKIPCATFSLRGEAGVTKDNSRLSDINLFLDLKGLSFEKEEGEALLKHIEKCKVHKTLKSACEISMVLV